MCAGNLAKLEKQRFVDSSSESGATVKVEADNSEIETTAFKSPGCVVGQPACRFKLLAVRLESVPWLRSLGARTTAAQPLT
jgi:hypothetical protein